MSKTYEQSMTLDEQKHQHSKNNRFDPNGLLLPKKIPNPFLESKERKEIHREILWKMKHSIDESKRNNEYKKVYQNYQQRLRNKEKETEATSFVKMLEEQKQRLHSVQNTGSLDTTSSTDLTNSLDASSSDSDEFHRILTRLRSSSSNNNNNHDHHQNDNNNNIHKIMPMTNKKNSFV